MLNTKSVFTVESKWKVFFRFTRVNRRVLFNKKARKFLVLSSDDFNEQLLEEHEKELEEIQLYYRHNEQLFTNLAHWHETWAEYREFQRQATDPDRFKRRGYSAIQEEKQRKHLEFTLKKLQEAVLQLSKDYEQEFLRKNMTNFCPERILVARLPNLSVFVYDKYISSHSHVLIDDKQN